MTETLTPSQALAVERPGGPILVSAAAGSGKTKVIVERLIRQILSPDQACSINDFLIITFTKKAAAELRARIARELAARMAEDPENRHLQKQQSRVYLTQISTVHAFCGDLLREFAYELDLPADFRMLEQSEAEALREQIADELLEEKYQDIAGNPALRQLIDGLGAGRDDRKIPELILGVYQTAQCNLYPDRWLADCQAQLDLEGITDAARTLWGAELARGLRDCAMEQAALMEGLLPELEAQGDLDKICALYRQNIQALRSLEPLDRWDVLRAAALGLEFGRFPAVRSCADPELKERAKNIRAQAIDLTRERAKELYGDSSQVLGDLGQTAETLGALFALTRDFAARFRAEKRRLHALDFNDLEHQAVALLLETDGKTPTPMARRISQRYREIMVDEYQDTNQVQDAIFRALSRDGVNRFMVGDVKQSIYRFRLADPGIFLEKYRAYPSAETADPGGRQRILLSHNFRSGEAILEAVNAVFSHCMSPGVGGLDYGPEEALRPGREMDPLPEPQVELHCLSTRREDSDADSPEKTRTEAAFAARRIRELLDRGTLVRGQEGPRPVEPGDIVILLRSPKNAAGIYLEALQRQGVPGTSDTGESILDAAEVETLLSILKVLDNAHRDIPLTGALLSPIFGVGASTLARLRQKGTDLWDALTRSRGADSQVDQALDLLEALRLQAQDLPLHSLLERIQRVTGLEAVYGSMSDGPARIRNLQTFCEIAAAFSEGGRKSLRQFLTHLEELRAQGGLPIQQPQTNAVNILSIHKSKGLEFPVVLLCGLSKRFNLEDLRTPVQFHSDLGAGCSVFDPATYTRFSSIAKLAISRRTRQENVSEELRILYVAMTRAKDRLIMTCCAEAMETRLQDLTLCLTPQTAKLQAAQAASLGDWVLLTALLRTEAGELHAIAGKPQGVSVSPHPWLIRYHAQAGVQTASVPASAAASGGPGPEPAVLARALAFRYPYAAAQRVPSKLTATQLKGRFLDQEADDGRPREVLALPRLRKPSLLQGEKPLTPAQRGTAVHLAMQFLDFRRTETLDQIRDQLRCMVEEAFLTPAQAEAVDPEKMLRVFRGPLGDRIRGAEKVLREFKFSLLTPAETYYPEAVGDRILLQGVTDCCLFQNGTITVVDFKTDRIHPGGEGEAGEKYRPQLKAYGLALSRIFGLPVTEKLLYFFATDTLLGI